MSDNYQDGRSPKSRPSGQNHNPKNAQGGKPSSRPASGARPAHPQDEATRAGNARVAPSGQGYSRAQAYERERAQVSQETRSTRPVAPEATALADELRARLRGKPTRAAHERHWYMEVLHGCADFMKTILVLLLCFCFLIGGFGGGMLIGYISTTTPLSIADITMTDSVETSFVYDANVPAP